MVYEYCLTFEKAVTIILPSELIHTFKQHTENCGGPHRKYPSEPHKGGTIAVQGPFAGARCHSHLSCPRYPRKYLKAPQSALALLETCRTIYVEAMPIFYQKNDLKILNTSSHNSAKYATAFLTQFPQRGVHIRNLSIDVEMKPGAHELARLLATGCPYLYILKLNLGTWYPLGSIDEHSRNIHLQETSILFWCFAKVRGLRVVELSGKYYSGAPDFFLPIEEASGRGLWLKLEMLKPKIENQEWLNTFFRQADMDLSKLTAHTSSYSSIRRQ